MPRALLRAPRRRALRWVVCGRAAGRAGGTRSGAVRGRRARRTRTSTWPPPRRGGSGHRCVGRPRHLERSRPRTKPAGAGALSDGRPTQGALIPRPGMPRCRRSPSGSAIRSPAGTWPSGAAIMHRWPMWRARRKSKCGSRTAAAGDNPRCCGCVKGSVTFSVCASRSIRNSGARVAHSARIPHRRTAAVQIVARPVARRAHGT